MNRHGEFGVIGGIVPKPSDVKQLRHRVIAGGPAALGNDELLALLIGGRRGKSLHLARQLLDRDGLLGLASIPPLQLRCHGASTSAAANIGAAFELVRRLANANRLHRRQLKTPADVADAVGAEMASLPAEELWLLGLDSQSQMIGPPYVVSRGDVDSTDAGPRAVFRVALQAGAVSAIVVHNHPSGDPTPSAADREATRRLVAAGRVVDVPLSDHVVIGTAKNFVSLRRAAPELWS